MRKSQSKAECALTVGWIEKEHPGIWNFCLQNNSIKNSYKKKTWKSYALMSISDAGITEIHKSISPTKKS